MTLSAATLAALEAARDGEREQIGFYRSLAVQAEKAGHEGAAERLNGLLADEQHHFSRLVARLMELDGTRRDVIPAAPRSAIAYPEWEPAARARERAEIERYESLLGLDLDVRTRAMIEEFLAAERRHELELGGKWMGA